MSALVCHFLDKSDNSIDQYQNFLHSDQPAARRFRYITFQVETKDIESIGLYEDFLWKISLWNTKNSRISRDVILTSENFNDVHVFEIPDVNLKEQNGHTYMYIDLVHRLSNIPVASGSQLIALPEVNGTSADTCDVFAVRKVSAQLPVCEHIKFWPTHDSVEYVKSNGTTCVALSASIGTIVTSGRVDSAVCNIDTVAATQLVPFTTVPLFQPTLLDRLRSTNASSGLSVERMTQCANIPCVWYLTVEDLQLTSDILDLYVDRHILVTAGCGGAASLAPHIYLGNILRYEGHYIEKAEIPISAVQVTLDEASSSFSSSFSPQHQQRHGDVYKSCLNFEVKVMECASGRGNMSAGENVLIDRCLLCVGVMQLAHKVSSTNDSNHSNGSGGVNCAPEDGSVLDPEELASGKYEVLLYTVYNPDAEIDVTLVGRVTVRLHIPECSLPVVVPIVPNGRASSSGFDLQRFVVHEKSTGASYLYWAQCLFSCCEALQRLVEEPENTVRERKAATAAAEIQKETLYSELKLLLQVLGRPEYTDCAVHAEIVKYLLSCGSNALRKLVLPALHAYFQDWLLSEELSALMWMSSSGSDVDGEDMPPGTISPTKGSTAGTTLLQPPSPSPHSPGRMTTRGSPSPGRTARPKSPFSPSATRPPQFSLAPPSDSAQVDWESVLAHCACIKFLTQTQAIMTEANLLRDSLSSGALAQATELMDHASLCEMSEDLVNALLAHSTRGLFTWIEWISRCPVSSVGRDAWRHLGPNCLRRIRKALAAMSLLMSSILSLAPTTQDAMQSFAAALLEFARVVVRMPGQHHLASKDWYTLWKEAIVREWTVILPVLLYIVKSYTFPHNNPNAALPGCLVSVCSVIELFFGANSVWLQHHQQQQQNISTAVLNTALAEAILVLSHRMGGRVTVFAGEGRDDQDCVVFGLPISLWSLRNASEKKEEAPAEPIIDPPQGPRKMNRRSSAVNMFGADVTIEAGAGTSAQAASGATLNGSVNSTPGVAASGSAFNGDGGGIGIGAVEETRTQNLLAAESYSEEAVLHFLHENKSYIAALRKSLNALLQLQPKPVISSSSSSSATSSRVGAGAGKGGEVAAEADRQLSVGALSGFHSLCELCDRITNGLCKGRVSRPEVLKALIRSSAESNSLSGSGMLIFMEFWGWLNGSLFTFLKSNMPLQMKTDEAVSQALAARTEELVLYHLAFCDILRDNARADRYLNRAVWLAHQAGTNADICGTMSLLAGSCVGSGFGAGILEAGNSTVLDTNASGSSSPSLWKRSFGSAAAAAAVSSTVQGLANSRAKRFEEFNAAGTVAATRWISVRRTLQDALYAVSEALVAIARTADITHGAADDISRTAGDDAHAGSILCVPFGKCVAVYSRNVLMLDLGALSDCRDIASALVTDTPLHIAMQELYQLAESIPVSLLPPSASTAAVSVEENQQNPLMLLISTIFDVVKLHSDLKPDPYPAGLDAATCALAQLLEDITLKGIQAAKDGAMFYMKNILKAPLNSYLLVTEDPAWSAQPIITMKVLGDGKQGQQRKKPPPAPSPFRQMMIEYLRSFRPESNLQASLVFLQREYSLHMMSAKLLVCSRHALSNEDPLLRQAPAQHALLRSMFEKTLLGSALANMLLFGLRFMGTAGQNAVDACLPPKVSSDNLLFMVSQLAEIFRSKPDASAASNALAGQNSSELLSVFGCSFKAYHDMLNLLIHRQQYAIEHPASGSLTTGTVAPKQPLTSSEMSRRLELEIFQLRHCLQGLLRSGQWEVGIEVAQLYLEKYKVVSSLPFVPPPPPPPLPQQVANPLLRSSPPPMPMPMSPTRNLIPIGTAAKPQTGTPQRAPFSPQGQHQLLQHFTFEDTKLSPLPQPPVTPSSAPSPAPTHTPILNPTASIAKRIDAMKAELVRVLDTLDSRVKSNGDLRLFSHFYALRFVSDTPWEASTQDETLQRALGHIREEGFQCTSAWMHVSAGASEEPGIATVAPVQSTASSVYEYWLLMKFDASSFPVCADFYDDILALDEQRVQDAKKGIHGGGRGGSGFSLVSPIAYHNIQAQLTMAYPAYTMVSSHHMMESYFSENTFDAARPGYIKFMQLFPAFPADICEEARLPAVLDALQAIQDAKAEKQRIVAEQLEATCEDIDAMDLTVRESNTAGGAGGGADGEAKAAESDTHYERMDAEDTDFITQLKKHQFTDATPTRFLAYSFMSDEQIAAMDREYQARGEELPEQSAYIQRFELAVSESCVSFADLNLPIDSELPCVRPANFAPLSSSNATAATAAAGVRSRYSRPLGTETGSVVDGTAAGAAASWPDSMKRLGVFDVSPVNLAVHQASTRCTPIEVSLETLYYVSVQVWRALAAMQKLNEFSKTELANEPSGDVISSDSIFAGVFTLLSNLLSMPNCNCLGFNNLETILVSEQERVDTEWFEERRANKQAYLRAVEEYEESKERESKKWKKYMKEKPAELDLQALEAAFYAQPRHAHLRSVQTLHDEAQRLLYKTIKEMRKFVTAKEDKVASTSQALTTDELRSIAIKKGRRPTVTNMVLRSNFAVHLSQMPDTMDPKGGPPVEPADTEKSLKMKLCLFVESLFAAMEVGIPI